MLAVTFVGGLHAMQPKYSPNNTWRTIANTKVTMTNVAPSMLIGMMMLTKHPQDNTRSLLLDELDLSSLRMFSCGGAAVPDSVVAHFQTQFPDVQYFTSYGMTETCGKIAFSLRSNNSNLGCPFMLMDVRVVTTKDDVLFEAVAADGTEVGEVQVRGQTLFSGYWKNSEATIASYTPDGEWFRTGDLAVLFEPHGFIQIVDRMKDMIIVGGENVYTTEVENVLHMHPEVQEVAVFGVPDEILGEVVCAVVVVDVHTVNDIDPGELVNMLSLFALECTQETPQSI